MARQAPLGPWVAIQEQKAPSLRTGTRNDGIPVCRQHRLVLIGGDFTEPSIQEKFPSQGSGQLPNCLPCLLVTISQADWVPTRG